MYNLNSKQAARKINKSVSRLYQLCQQRALNFQKCGSRLMFDEEKLDQWLQERTYEMKSKVEILEIARKKLKHLEEGK